MITGILVIAAFAIAAVIGIIYLIFSSIASISKTIEENAFEELKSAAIGEIGNENWTTIREFDERIVVKSRQMLEKYDAEKFFKENTSKLKEAELVLVRKHEVGTILKKFLDNNNFKSHSQYHRLKEQIEKSIVNSESYKIRVEYITPARNTLYKKEINIGMQELYRFKNDPTLLMSKGEYNRYLKEKEKEAVSIKQHEYYDRINKLIDYAVDSKGSLIIKGSKEQVDSLVDQLYCKSVNNIKRIKTLDSEEWELIGKLISHIDMELEKIISKNKHIYEYYESPDFHKIKETCEKLMDSQREFNEYISEKMQSISRLFGTKVVRNETIHNDEYEYIRPYKKTISPFTAEVSAAVFSSAENNKIEYVVKQFYPNKQLYPEQIQKLQMLLEELETLKEARQIIEDYKEDYQQYLGDVPNYIMEEDRDGFYYRLGFAQIDESDLTVEYKFEYTSGGGKAQRTFTVPMTEETIVELIRALESKLTASSFAKEQRTLMTKKLREQIKNRDNHTCCYCGNSTMAEPNLLLEIDHIVPIAKGGVTVEENLQTLCWKCNRSKSDKLLIKQSV